MALLGTFTKQPREVLDCDFNYATTLEGRTDTMSATFTTEVSPTGAGALVVSSAVRTDNIIKLTVSGGTSAQTYKVTVLATTTAGLVYEDEINVIVEEV